MAGVFGFSGSAGVAAGWELCQFCLKYHAVMQPRAPVFKVHGVDQDAAKESKLHLTQGLHEKRIGFSVFANFFEVLLGSHAGCNLFKLVALRPEQDALIATAPSSASTTTAPSSFAPKPATKQISRNSCGLSYCLHTGRSYHLRLFVIL